MTHTDTLHVAPAVVQGLSRSSSHRWLGGVCGGIGRMTGLAPWVWRFAFTSAVLFAGTGVLLYALLWLLLPSDQAVAHTHAAR